MWTYREAPNYQRFQYHLHNTEVDYFDAPHLERHTYHQIPWLQIAMPFIGTYEENLKLMKLYKECFQGHSVDDVKGILSHNNKEIRAAKVWFKQIYHLLRLQNSFRFTKVLGTQWRWFRYQEYTVFCGRKLTDSLIGQGWKYETAAVLIVSDRDWYIWSNEFQYDYLSTLACHVFFKCPEKGYVDFLPQCEFWKQKDQMAFRFQGVGQK